MKSGDQTLIKRSSSAVRSETLRKKLLLPLSITLKMGRITPRLPFFFPGCHSQPGELGTLPTVWAPTHKESTPAISSLQRQRRCQTGVLSHCHSPSILSSVSDIPNVSSLICCSVLRTIFKLKTLRSLLFHSNLTLHLPSISHHR